MDARPERYIGEQNNVFFTTSLQRWSRNEVDGSESISNPREFVTRFDLFPTFHFNGGLKFALFTNLT